MQTTVTDDPRHPLLANYNLKPVSREAFFAYINPRNVSPNPEGRHHHDWGYLSEWRDTARRLVAVTVSGSTFRPKQYFLPA